MRRKYMRLFKRTKRNVIISVFIILICLFILRSDIFEPFEPDLDISCHYILSNNSFPLLEKCANLPSRSIFFLATSCPGNLTSREYCAIESAARMHPDWQINVLFSDPTPVEQNVQDILNNVKLWRVHIKEFSKGTPFEAYYKSGILKKCKWGVRLSRDVLKILTLGFWGGIYLDLDVVVARPLAFLVRSWATRETDDSVGEGILSFSKDVVGRNVSEIAIKEMYLILRRGECSYKRPTVMANVLRSVCSTADVASMSSATCNGFEVYGPQFFHPIPKTRAYDYFIPRELVTDNAYTYNLWNHITKGYRVIRTSPVAKLARRYCPLTFKLYSNQFGY